MDTARGSSARRIVLRRLKEERQEKLVRFKRLAQHLCNRVSASVSKCGEKTTQLKCDAYRI